MSSSYNALQVSVDKRFASGYSINSAFTWANADNQSRGEFGQRPDVVAGVGRYDVPGGQSRNHWYNPAAFNTSFSCCRWGNAGRSSMRGPGMASADWAFWKEFKFKTPLNREETKIQFRW